MKYVLDNINNKMSKDIFAESRKNQAEFEWVVAEMKPSETDYILIARGQLVGIGTHDDLENMLTDVGVYMLKSADDKIPTIKKFGR